MQTRLCFFGKEISVLDSAVNLPSSGDLGGPCLVDWALGGQREGHLVSCALGVRSLGSVFPEVILVHFSPEIPCDGSAERGTVFDFSFP